jgi:hypothetical protein
MLNVMTFLKETFPFLQMLMSSLYVPRGEEPVGNPRTKGFFAVGFAALILAAM